MKRINHMPFTYGMERLEQKLIEPALLDEVPLDGYMA